MYRRLFTLLIILCFGTIEFAPVRAQDGTVPEPELEIQLNATFYGFGVYSIEWKSDETQLLAYGFDTAAYVLDTLTGARLLTLDHIVDPPPSDQPFALEGISEASWSPDETRILTVDKRDVKIWDAANGTLLLTLPIFETTENAVPDASWSPDGSRILVQHNFSQFVQIWDAQTGAVALTLVHPGIAFQAEWSPDGSHILTLGLPKSVDELEAEIADILPDDLEPDELPALMGMINLKAIPFIWDAADGHLVAQLSYPEAQVKVAKWNQNGNHVITVGGADYISWFLSTLTGAIVAAEEDEPMPSADMQALQGPSTVRVWNTMTGQVELEIQQDSTIEIVEYSPDETRILTNSLGGPIFIWDATSGEKLVELSHQSGLLQADWSLDGTQIMAFSQEPFDCGLTGCTLIWSIWNATTGALISEHEVDPCMARIVYWNQQREFGLTTRVALPVELTGEATECDFAALIIDQQGEERLRFPQDTTIMDLKWSPTETRIATSDKDGVIWIWKVNLTQ